MSQIEPEVGDRFTFHSLEWGVERIDRAHVLGRRFALLPQNELCAELRRVVTYGKGERRVVTIERLKVAYVFTGNYNRPKGFRVSKHGPSWFVVTPAGNVVGPPAGVVWSELDAMTAAKAEAAALQARFNRGAAPPVR